MNTQDDTAEERRDETDVVVRRSPSPSSSAGIESGDRMKRAAAKQLIERYYYQLTDGCGGNNCGNVYCASSQKFCYPELSRNQAAVRALQLFKEKATLCGGGAASKVAKTSESGNDEPMVPEKSQDRQSQPSTSSTSSTVASSSADNSSQIRDLPPFPPVHHPVLTEEKIHSIVEECQKEENWKPLIRLIGQTFNNPDSLVGSFLRTEPEPKSKEDMKSMEVDEDKDTDEQEGSSDVEEGSSLSNIQNQDAYVRLKDGEVTVDIESVRRAYKELFSIPDEPFQPALSNALMSLSRDLEMELKFHRAYERDPNYLNIFVIVFEIPSLQSPGYIDKALPMFCRAAGCLPLEAQARLARVWNIHCTHHIKAMVDSLQQLITVKVITTEWGQSQCVNDDPGITGAAKILKILFYASILAGRMDSAEVIEEEHTLQQEVEVNLQDLLQGAIGHEAKEKNQPPEDPLEKELGIHPIDCRSPLVPWEDFLNESLSDNIDMQTDYINYRAKNDKFTFMTHSFLLTTAVKNSGMYYDNRIRMMNERRATLFHNLMHGAASAPVLKLRIRRDHIIDDALLTLEVAATDNPQDLKKQLYVEFEGEQGIDEGGVSKEFFQLVVEEIFNPDIGMFTFQEETQTFWFNPTSFENDGHFTLIGIVLGLAIYNNVILDVHFPMVVYRKLMGKKGILEDLKHSHPNLVLGLQNLLAYEGEDVEEVFMQTFTVSYQDVFGTMLTRELKPGGDLVPVTSENKKEFVDLYADFLLNKSIEKQFKAFQRGFHMVTDESPLKMLFRPEDIEELVCGSLNYDFHALEDTTDYDGGFTVTSLTIRNFWELVHDFSDEQKRKLLQFTTGSDRVPVGGLSKLKLIIARNGPDSDRLPTAHTCFNVLLLPNYDTKEKLEERLLKAITYAKGFGML